MRVIGIRYEDRWPETTSETVALKAVEEPMLMRPKRAFVEPVSAIAHIGRAQ